jgi:hypothetical protein
MTPSSRRSTACNSSRRLSSLGVIHYDDTTGGVARLDAARRHSLVDGIATQCGMARGDPARLPSLVASHARIASSAG